MDEQTESEFSGGFVPIVRAEGDMTLREGGAIALVAGGDGNIREAGTGFFVVGGNAELKEGGAGTVIVGGNAEISECGIGQMAAVQASVTGGRVGLLVAGNVSMEQSEVLVTVKQAAVFGAIAGAVLFLLGKLFGR